MKAYLDILENCLTNGIKSDNRTGIPTIRIPQGATFQHDMKDGFPLLTTKFTPLKTISTELEFFINGYTDKKWLQDRNCNIWNQWASEPAWKPLYKERLKEAKKSGIIITADKDKEIKESAMSDTRDLGPVYGWQWRHWNGKYVWNPENPALNYSLKRPGVDQLKRIIETAKKSPNDRRLIVNAWNPSYQKDMALPPCHYCWQITILNNTLDLMWNQRSCDMFLGIPFNIASYAMLLLLLAKELNCEPGILRGNLGDVHIYENHINQVKEQLSRKPYRLPEVAINNENWNGIFNWHADGGYKYLTEYLRHGQLRGDVAR